LVTVMALVTSFASEADLSEIIRIENASFAPAIRESKETYLDRIRACPGCCTVLAEKTAQTPRLISGYLSAEIWNHIPAPAVESYRLGHTASDRHDENGKILYVSSFAIDPLSRGGVGRVFFRESLSMIESRYPAIEHIVFIVHEDWLAARHIYETECFRYAGEIPGFFPDGRRALVMEKER
jgi:ribosomal protein S18 acetylase RimI-like enzyme